MHGAFLEKIPGVMLISLLLTGLSTHVTTLLFGLSTHVTRLENSRPPFSRLVLRTSPNRRCLQSSVRHKFNFAWPPAGLPSSVQKWFSVASPAALLGITSSFPPRRWTRGVVVAGNDSAGKASTIGASAGWASFSRNPQDKTFPRMLRPPAAKKKEKHSDSQPAAEQQPPPTLVLQLQAPTAPEQNGVSKTQPSQQASQLPAADSNTQAKENVEEDAIKIWKQTNAAVDAQLKDTQHRLQEATARADASEKQRAASLEKAAKSASDVQAQMQKELNSSRAEIDKLTKANAEVQAKLKAAQSDSENVKKQAERQQAASKVALDQLQAHELEQERLAQELASTKASLSKTQSQASQELKDLHTMLAQQQEEFEKQRVLMMHQRDGVEKVFEHDLNEMILRLQEATAHAESQNKQLLHLQAELKKCARHLADQEAITEDITRVNSRLTQENARLQEQVENMRHQESALQEKVRRLTFEGPGQAYLRYKVPINYINYAYYFKQKAKMNEQERSWLQANQDLEIERAERQKLQHELDMLHEANHALEKKNEDLEASAFRARTALRDVEAETGMEMKRTRERERENARDRQREREMEKQRQEEKERLFQEEKRRIEAECEKKCRELTEQYARDRQEAEQKNTALIEQMSTLNSYMANLKEERQ